MLPLTSECLNPSGKDTTKEFSTEWELEFKICPGFSVCEKNIKKQQTEVFSQNIHHIPSTSHWLPVQPAVQKSRPHASFCRKAAALKLVARKRPGGNC